LAKPKPKARVTRHAPDGRVVTSPREGLTLYTHARSYRGTKGAKAALREWKRMAPYFDPDLYLKTLQDEARRALGSKGLNVEVWAEPLVMDRLPHSPEWRAAQTRELHNTSSLCNSPPRKATARDVQRR
jgi:hypothetical protein